MLAFLDGTHSNRARVALAFVVGLLCVGASPCSSTKGSTQQEDASTTDLDATLACGGGGLVVYEKPGCGAAAEPLCETHFDGCAGSFCDCDGHTFWDGCGFSSRPFASYGPCPGDDAGFP